MRLNYNYSKKTMSQLSEQELVRREKLKNLRALGIDPYPANLYPVNHTSKQIKQDFAEGKKVVVAGRLMSRRIQGKASFAELQDSAGRIQVYFNRDEICTGEDKTLYNDVYKKLLDIGDFIGIEGELFTTQVGEKTIMVKHFSILSKSLKPLPQPRVDAEGNVHDAFTDPEQRYRQRYADLVVNPKVKDTFIKRTQIVNTIRAFYNEMGFLEVETPILQPIPGGAAARPFITHHNALDMPLYLRIANELYLKRLIVGGFDGVYEFAKDFRNEGMDRTHNPEFTVMEMYAAYKDYNWMMDTTEKLLEKIAITLHGTTQVEFNGKTIDYKAPYKRIGILDAIKEHTGFDLYMKSEDEIRKACKSLNIEVDETLMNNEIPLFLIQPLVENAVKHGISQNEGEGTIRLKIEKEVNKLLISVSDNGPDFPEGLVSGHGLQTVYDLLRLNYKDNASLNWTNTPKKMIMIQIPDTV